MIIWLSSYPRSGNTFFRVVLNSVFNIKTYSIYNDTSDIGADKKTSEVVGHEFLPENFSIDKAREEKRVYYIKTHELVNNINLSDKDKVIYLVRDGRESSLSFTRYLKNFHSKEDEDLSEVLYGNTSFGSWAEHIEQWSRVKNKLVIKFEDLTDNPMSQIENIRNYIDLEVENKQIPTFEELKKINPMFFNSGKKDSWKNIYTKDEHLFFWLSSAKEMSLMGYNNDVPEEMNNETFKQYAYEFEKHITTLKDMFRTKNKIILNQYNSILSQLKKTQMQYNDLTLELNNQKEQYNDLTLELTNQKEQYNDLTLERNIAQNKLNSLISNKWYRFGQMSRKRKIWTIGKVLSKKLKLYWLLQPIAKKIKDL